MDHSSSNSSCDKYSHDRPAPGLHSEHRKTVPAVRDSRRLKRPPGLRKTWLITVLMLAWQLPQSAIAGNGTIDVGCATFFL